MYELETKVTRRKTRKCISEKKLAKTKGIKHAQRKSAIMFTIMLPNNKL